MYKNHGINHNNAPKQEFEPVRYIPKSKRCSKKSRITKKDKLPKLDNVLDAGVVDMKVAETKNRKRKNDGRTIYTKEKYADNWRKILLSTLANKLAKSTNFPSD